jgi:two-component system, cell cycle sensor histidine kinase and response regulator CckA
MKPPDCRILVVDDNPAIHEDFDKILAPKQSATASALGAAETLLFGTPSSGAFPAPKIQDSIFTLSHAMQGQDGLTLVEQSIAEGRPYSVAFIDMRMPPGWDGLETAERIIKADPAIQVVICTAYSDYSWDEIRARLQRPDGLLILKKPFDVVEVLQMAHNLTRKWELTREVAAAMAEQDRRVDERTAELKASRERFVALFRSAPLAQMIVDARGPEGLEVNDAFCRLTGSGEAIWKSRETAGVAVNSTGIAGILRWKHPVHGAEATIRDCKGEEKHILLSSVVLGLGGAPSLLLMMQDVTERRRLEADVRQIQKLDAVGQLAAGVAHDFNNLLTVIGGNAELVREARENGVDFEEQLVEEIIESSARATTLTRQLLDFTRRQVFQPRALSFNSLVENQLSFLARILGEHIEIIWRPGAYGDTVFADAGSLEQVTLNLAINARDAMPKGGRLTLATGFESITSPEEALRRGIRLGDYVTLRCRDIGSGMTAEVAERAFEPFFTTKDTGKGTGLGLASVYGIVKRHDGTIHFETEPGKGTEFIVLLPFTRDAELMPEPNRCSTIPANRGEGLTILFVEDEPAVRRIGMRLLASLGHRAIEAIDGHSGLAKWRDHNAEIDLVITDMVMPGGMSGLQLADTIQGGSADMPVIFASGYSNEMLRDEQVVLDPLRGFLPKPYDQSSLREAIARAPRAPNPGKTPGLPA